MLVVRSNRSRHEWQHYVRREAVHMSLPNLVDTAGGGAEQAHMSLPNRFGGPVVAYRSLCHSSVLGQG